MKSKLALYDPAIWNTKRRGDCLDCDLPWSEYIRPWSEYIRSRGIPLYTEAELAKLDAKGALDRMSDADRETLFREARAAS